MTQILVFSKYAKQAASTRHRFIQFSEKFDLQGIKITLSPFFNDDYVYNLYANGKVNPWQIFTAIFRRLYGIMSAKKYDLVIIHCDLIPYCPGWIEQLLLRNISYVYDYDDAIFHNYDEHKWWVIRKLLGHKIARIIGNAKAVMAGSHYLADYAKQYNSNVVLIPTVIDLNRYLSESYFISSELFRIGWIGSPSTSVYITEIFEVLKKLASESPIRLIAIGAKSFSIDGVDVEIRTWHEDTEVKDLLECDIGIMPLSNHNWARGKCAFKLIQYMGCKLPVVASAIGENNYLVNNECGLLVSDSQQWLEALRKLRDNPGLRENMGLAGLEIVKAEYCTDIVAPKIVKLLLSNI